MIERKRVTWSRKELGSKAPASFHTTDQNVAGNYSTAIFSVSGVRTKIVTPALRQTSNLSFDQSFYGSDQISDPTGEISNILSEINRKYGNLISIKQGLG